MKTFAKLCFFLLLSSLAYAGPQIIRDKTTKAVIRTSPTPIRLDGKIPLDLDPALELVDVVDPPIQPAYNAATHKLVVSTAEQASVGGLPIKLVTTWNIVALTQAELDARAAAAADETERQQLKTIVAALKAGTGTTAERLARCERALAKIIPDLYRQ